MRRRRNSHTVRNTVVSVVVLLFLFIGSGVAYVYFVGNSSDKQASPAQVEVPTQSLAIPKPQKPGPNAAVGASVQSLLSPVGAGSNTSINVKTTATATCTITATYNNVPSKDSGLSPKTADDYGNVSWTWTVDKSASAGKWPVRVTCAYGKRSAMVQGDLQVTR